jgi:hypothetical protein
MNPGQQQFHGMFGGGNNPSTIGTTLTAIMLSATWAWRFICDAGENEEEQGANGEIRARGTGKLGEVAQWENCPVKQVKNAGGIRRNRGGASFYIQRRPRRLQAGPAGSPPRRQQVLIPVDYWCAARGRVEAAIGLAGTSNAAFLRTSAGRSKGKSGIAEGR